MDERKNYANQNSLSYNEGTQGNSYPISVIGKQLETKTIDKTPKSLSPTHNFREIQSIRRLPKVLKREVAPLGILT